MTVTTVATSLLNSDSLVNVAARGQPGAAAFHDATRAEVVVLNDTVAPPLWRGSAVRAEAVTATAAQAFVGSVQSASLQEFTNPSDSFDAISSAAGAPVWGSPDDTVFEVRQGGTLNMNNVLRFSDPDADPLTITQISGALPQDATYDEQTGLISVALTTPVGISEDLVFEADDGIVSVLLVGPSRQYTTIRAAILAAQDGDIIQIDAGDYIGDVATISADRLTIKGVGGRARLFANNAHESGKGIWVVNSGDCTFEDIDFHDAEGPSHNGAGICLEGTGLATIRRCGFFDCENGILSNGSGTVLLELCEFARNGYGDALTHNVDLGQHLMVTARDCYFHEAQAGHEFKSQAKENILERCYFVNGPAGTGLNCVNVDSGGRLVIRGCMFHKGPNTTGQRIIFHNTNVWGASFNSITLEHCTLVHDYTLGSFIYVVSGTTTVTLTASLFASDGLALVVGATPVQNSNFQTTVDKLPSASVIADPYFWPDASIHASLVLPAPIVPTYLIDAPHVFTQRPITAARAIGGVQNSIQITGSVGPVLWASDLVSGPNTGNSDTSYGQTADANGCYVSVWGANLGASQGTSTITCNGAAVSVIPYWGPAVPPWSPANLSNGYQNWQIIIFQVPAAAASGLGQIVVTVGGVVSKTVVTTYSDTTGFSRVIQDGLPFTVRAGRIRFAKTVADGGSATGNGTWTSPYDGVIRLKNNLTTPGDIGYATSGAYGAGISLEIGPTLDGTEAAPIALLAYPGADVQLGTLTSNATNCWKVRAAWRVIAKFKVWGGVESTLQCAFDSGYSLEAVGTLDGIRIVGCNIQAPLAYDDNGTIMLRGASKRRVLFNEFTNISTSVGYMSLYHVIYSAGVREILPPDPRPPNEIDHEYAFNYFHNNNADGAMQLYNSANTAGATPAYVQGYNIHHNVIVDQMGHGVMSGEAGGFNDLHNNIIMRVGREGVSMRSPIASWNVYNNTFINNGTDVARWGPNGTVGKNQLGSIGWKGDNTYPYSGVHTFKNNIIVQTRPTNNHYIAVESSTQDPIRPANNNLWYGAGSPPSWDAASLNVDPEFVNYVTEPFDLRLQQTSLAVDVGVNVSAVVDFDLDGRPYPQGAAFDLGAYECFIAGS